MEDSLIQVKPSTAAESTQMEVTQRPTNFPKEIAAGLITAAEPIVDHAIARDTRH
jgi:hypothetical protein